MLGDATGVTGVRMSDVRSQRDRGTRAAWLFIAIGHKPNTEIFEGQLEMEDGYISRAAGSDGIATVTSVPGVFAAGDVQDHVYRQAVTSRRHGLHGRARRRAIPRDAGCHSEAAPPDRRRVAKLSDLKSLLDAKADAELGRRGRHAAPAAKAHARRRSASRRNRARSVTRCQQARESDIDLHAGIRRRARMPPRNRVAPAKPRPAPHPRSRIEDERDVLELSKYGAEPAPHSWDIGQELEGEQTSCVAASVRRPRKLRRGHWSVQAVIDLHGMTTTKRTTRSPIFSSTPATAAFAACR